MEKNNDLDDIPGPEERLENLLRQPGNRFCADCSAPDPKWVSLNLGVFVCIKCSGVHRSLGVHISKIISVKLDGWTSEQVDSVTDGGGNGAINMRYEAFLPENYKKPTPESSAEERVDFIKRKYVLQQFLNSNVHIEESQLVSLNSIPQHVKKQYTGGRRLHRLGHALRRSWRKNSESKSAKTNSTLQLGMVEFVGLMKVNMMKGTNLAIRDMLSSDPYVVVTMGHQSIRTQVVKSSLNPVWNERLILAIPDSIPSLKLQVYDKDTFSTDDRMGEADIDIQPLVAAARACENSTITGPMQLGKFMANDDNGLIEDSIITCVDGNVKQIINLRLQNVETGELEIELECVPLSH